MDGRGGSSPCELVNDCDLLLLIDRMLRSRGYDTVRITKVMVLDGTVREQDKVGNDAADEAADLGRRRVGHAVIDTRRNLSGFCGRWYPVILDLHRVFIAKPSAVVNHDGCNGTAPDPLVWSAGALPRVIKQCPKPEQPERPEQPEQPEQEKEEQQHAFRESQLGLKQTHTSQTKIDESVFSKVSTSNNNYSFRIINHSTAAATAAATAETPTTTTTGATTQMRSN